MKGFLSEEEKKRLLKAIEDAEKQTSGEIVVYIVKQSDAYWEAIFKGGLILNAAAIVFLGIMDAQPSLSGRLSLSGSLILLVVSTLAGLLLAYIPFLRRILAGSRLLDYRVHAKAKEAFLEKEVFNTTQRIGILIFVSLLEHRVVVIGDSGINRKVTSEEWKSITELVITGIKQSSLVDGLEKAISKSAELLIKHGFTILPGDRNELPDEIIEKP